MHSIRSSVRCRSCSGEPTSAHRRRVRQCTGVSSRCMSRAGPRRGPPTHALALGDRLQAIGEAAEEAALHTRRAMNRHIRTLRAKAGRARIRLGVSARCRVTTWPAGQSRRGKGKRARAAAFAGKVSPARSWMPEPFVRREHASVLRPGADRVDAGWLGVVALGADGPGQRAARIVAGLQPVQYGTEVVARGPAQVGAGGAGAAGTSATPAARTPRPGRGTSG